MKNYHTHTVRCKHARGYEEDYIEAAIRKGFSVLGFSDHVPVPYPKGFVSGIRMDVSEIEDYTETLLRLRDKYKDDIQILIGYEAEYMPPYFDEMMKRIQEYPLDYLIQGQHFVKDEISGIYAGSPTTEEAHLKDYVDVTIEGMKTGVFSCLAHPDLIHFIGDVDFYRAQMERLIKEAISLNIPLEVNALGYLTRRNYPCSEFFSLASEMNADFIFGCDAHSPDAILRPKDILGFPQFLEKNNITFTESAFNFPLKEAAQNHTEPH